MDTEYCHKCGFLHDPADGDCLGCEMAEELVDLKTRLKNMSDNSGRITKYYVKKCIELEARLKQAEGLIDMEFKHERNKR